MTAGQRSRVSGETGAASLEYAGFLLIVTLVVSSLLIYATPIGAALQSRICAAVGAVCGTAAAEQRAKDLSVKCTVARTSRDLGYDVAVTGFRGERKDTDGVTAFGDDTALVTMTQGAGVGVDGSTKLGTVAEATAKATVNGDVGYVYSFPNDLGGATAAQDFLSSERDGFGQAVDILVPGAQTIDEGVSRAANATKNFVEDELLSHVGLGPSAEDRAERERQQRAGTADAMTVSLSLQGSAGVSVGAGVPTKGSDGKAGKVEGPLGAGASIKAVIKGQSTVGLTDGESDSVASSFQGSASIDAGLEVYLGVPGDAGQRDLPPFLTVAGQAGALGSYKVIFDGDGNPVRLVLAYEYTYGGKAAFTPPKLGSKEVKLAVGSSGTKVSERTVILDLASDNAEGQANRDAFDDLFTVQGVSVDGRTAKVAVPQLTNFSGFLNAWDVMTQRIDSDGFIVDATYSETKSADDVGIKVAGTGLGGQRSTTTRQLTDASLFDNRNGGAEVDLATCEAP